MGDQNRLPGADHRALLVALLLPYAPRLLLRSSLLAAVAALAGLVTFLH